MIQRRGYLESVVQINFQLVVGCFQVFLRTHLKAGKARSKLLSSRVKPEIKIKSIKKLAKDIWWKFFTWEGIEYGRVNKTASNYQVALCFDFGFQRRLQTLQLTTVVLSIKEKDKEFLV